MEIGGVRAEDAEPLGFHDEEKRAVAIRERPGEIAAPTRDEPRVQSLIVVEREGERIVSGADDKGKLRLSRFGSPLA